MQAYEFINSLIPPLKLTDRAGMALSWMEEIRTDSLPVTDQGKFLGFIEDEIIFEQNDSEELIGKIQLEGNGCWVYSDKHIYDVLRVASENQ
ncbi:MAG: cbs domain containing protein, partial [Algoriphagus sp.]|nr:cbs domain containing protein [Algoriphagus sp.]